MRRKSGRNYGGGTALWLLLCGMVCYACAKAPPGQAELALGTKCGVNLFEYGNSKLYSRIFGRIREIDRTMSAREGVLHNGPSTVMVINQQAGIAPVKVGDDLFEVLQTAVRYAELSGGAFDPTVGPLVSLWGIGTETEKIPDQNEIEQALALINWKELILDREKGTAYLQRKGMELDLGAIAKGYAADEAVRIAREARAGRALIDLGGNIAVMGNRGGAKRRMPPAPWRIGIQDPLAERNAYIGVLLVSDKSVVTSGIYERYFENNAKRYHHILSTTDGYPVDNGLISVTIVADRSIDADGLSTAVFALGFQQGLSLLQAIPETEVIFIFDDRSVYITGGLIDLFMLTTDEYTMKETT
jgi:thiamine biosynthesis lipoprotein